MIPGKVKSIKVSGVYGQGDYDLSTEIWKYGATSTYVIKLNDASVNAGVITPLTDKNSALMMIPQIFGADADAKVSMVFNYGGKDGGNKDKTVSFRLHNTSWEAGKHITYMLSSSKITTLNMGSLTYPTGWNSVNTGANAKNQIRKAYASNTSAGLFVVNEKNKVIEANVQLTYDGTSWSLKGSKLKFSPQYNYFVYYPYQKGGLPGAPAKDASNIDVTSAEKFFANAIANWKIAADQSTLDNMNACDLQIGKASVDDDGCSVSFEMKHAMGLAEITLGATTFDNNYYLSNYPSYTWKNGTTTFHAYAGISGHSFYQVADSRYVAVVKPKVTTVFSCGDKNNLDAWTENVSVMPAANGVAKVIAISKRTSLSNMPYTMEVGDIYYSDGAMTHQSEDLASGKTPIGIVGYLGNDYWTEKGVISKDGHALVMCLKTIGSTGSTKAAQEEFKNGKNVQAYIGTKYAWYSSNIDAGRTKVNSKSLLVNSYDETYGSGYTETNALIKFWGKDADATAANAAKNYTSLPAPTNKCTGWFLPSAGQYYAVMSQLGGGIKPDNWEINKSFGNMKNVTTNINKMLEKVGDSNYTEFFGDINTWAWTSSEYYYTSAVFIDSGVDDGLGSGAVLFAAYDVKKKPRPVRPFLAF